MSSLRDILEIKLLALREKACYRKGGAVESNVHLIESRIKEGKGEVR
jgi:hypothetical protein